MSPTSFTVLVKLIGDVCWRHCCLVNERLGIALCLVICPPEDMTRCKVDTESIPAKDALLKCSAYIQCEDTESQQCTVYMCLQVQ